ncbi:MAG: L,D-transpeptidase family protein [Planctomycetota bacterium]|nr:L,D-transpeptidase family protein [Planctomycetota bacterium]
MWNSSRRIALFSTSLVLLAAGLFGATWFAHWLPMEIGEAETGDLATQETVAELNELDWSSFADNGDAITKANQDSGVYAQTEPGFGSESVDQTQAGAGEFVDRNRWLSQQVTPANSDRLTVRTDDPHASTSIPNQFPVADVSNDRRPRSAGTIANGALSAGYESDSPGIGQIAQTASSGGSSSTPPRLFDTDKAPSFREARGFPTEVAFVERTAGSDLFAPAESETANEPPDFESETNTQGRQADDPPVRTAARTVPQKSGSPSADEASPESKLQQIDEWLANRNYVAAHRELSTLYWNHPELKSVILKRIEKNAQTIYFSPESHFLEPYEIQQGDFLQRVAPKYGINWEYLAALNGVDPRRIRVGQKLKVIKGPFSAFVDLSDFELTIHCHGFFVKRYPIGIGREDSTPVGKFAVLDRITSPQYTDPNGRVIEGGQPTNPLGTHWIDLGDSYGIHGTIDPDSIGKAESAGCVRMRNEDVVEVYDFLVKGSEVVIRP